MIDKVILIITIAVCIVVVEATSSPFVTGEPLSDEKAEILKSIVISLISIISMYVGFKLRGDNKEDNK